MTELKMLARYIESLRLIFSLNELDYRICDIIQNYILQKSPSQSDFLTQNKPREGLVCFFVLKFYKVEA